MWRETNRLRAVRRSCRHPLTLAATAIVHIIVNMRKVLTMRRNMMLSCAFLLGATGAQAEEYRATTWIDQGHILTKTFMYGWAEDVAKRSNGEITFEVFPNSALVPAASIAKGVADGLAHVGYHTAAYTPSNNPVSQALSGMGFLNSDPYVLGFAYTDFVMNEAIGYQDWRDDNVIPIGGFSAPVIRLICVGDGIRTAEDMKGKRIRTPGGYVAKFVEDLGGTNVSMSATELFQAMQVGAIDCTANDPPWLIGGSRLADVADSVTMIEVTPLFTSPAYVYNVDFWKGLTPEQRRLLLDATATAMANMQKNYTVEVEAGLAAAREKGVELIEPDATLVKARQDWIDGGLGGMSELASGTYKIENPEALFTTFQGYMDKWSKLLEGVKDRNDVDEVTAFLKANLFDKIDVETYGLN